MDWSSYFENQELFVLDGFYCSFLSLSRELLVLALFLGAMINFYVSPVRVSFHQVQYCSYRTTTTETTFFLFLSLQINQFLYIAHLDYYYYYNYDYFRIPKTEISHALSKQTQKISKSSF